MTKTTNRASGDEYSLDIYPFYLSAVLRADTFWRDVGIPLVPYAKLGFAYGLWRASNSLGTSNVNGSKGRGGSLGTHVAIGLAFALDALDSGALAQHGQRGRDQQHVLLRRVLLAEPQRPRSGKRPLRGDEHLRDGPRLRVLTVARARRPRPEPDAATPPWCASPVGSARDFATSSSPGPSAPSALPSRGGVLTVNVVGSFLIALIGILALTRAEMTPLLRLTLTTGFLGGLTTYSAFNQDTLSMIDKKLYGTAVAYIAITVVGCLAAGFAGAIVGRRV